MRETFLKHSLAFLGVRTLIAYAAKPLISLPIRDLDSPNSKNSYRCYCLLWYLWFDCQLFKCEYNLLGSLKDLSYLNTGLNDEKSNSPQPFIVIIFWYLNILHKARAKAEFLFRKRIYIVISMNFSIKIWTSFLSIREGAPPVGRHSKIPRLGLPLDPSIFGSWKTPW